MYKKIDVYVNGEYKFSSQKYRSCKELKDHIRAVKRIYIESIPSYWLDVCDYDKLIVRYAKGN